MRLPLFRHAMMLSLAGLVLTIATPAQADCSSELDKIDAIMAAEAEKDLRERSPMYPGMKVMYQQAAVECANGNDEKALEMFSVIRAAFGVEETAPAETPSPLDEDENTSQETTSAPS